MKASGPALGVAEGAQAYDADLVAVANLSTTGLVARTAAGTAATRSVASADGQITVANGDGVAGNLTMTLAYASALRETSGPTTMTMGAVADLQVLRRSGSTVVGASVQVISSQTITGSTGTISAGTTTAILTHASPTITLPAISGYAAGSVLDVSGPIGTASYAFLVCAGPDTYSTGAPGIRISGAGYCVRLLSDGTTWRVDAVVGVCELPVVSITLTGIAGASPWTVTNAYTGGTMSLTDRSISSTASSASSGLVLTPSVTTATWGSGTGSAASLDLADLGLSVDDEWAIVGVYAIAGSWSTDDAVNGVLGTVISTTMAGCQTLNATPTASVRWGGTTTNINHGTVTSPNVIGVWNRGLDRAVRALAGTVSGTFGTAWSPLQVADPAGTSYQVLDPNALTASQVNWKAVFTRFLLAASRGATAETWTFSGIYAVRIIRGR